MRVFTKIKNMELFTELVKKQPTESAEKKEMAIVPKKRPAWTDEQGGKAKNMVSLEKTSRLRKLKKTENEKEVRVDVYEKRLKQ